MSAPVKRRGGSSFARDPSSGRAVSIIEADDDNGRENWGGPLDFMVAAINAAIGLGTVVRFPFLAYQYGGGAFLIPYIVANVCIGCPLLGLELTMGQYMQRGALQAFAKAHRRMWGLGFGAAYASFCTICYYNVIMAW
jgi:SNF family Na+-dependent transporter